MLIKDPTTGIFRLKRYFAIIGLGSTIIAAIFLVLLYRHMAISDIIILGERNNLVLAQTVLNSVKDELIEYLTADNANNKNPVARHGPLPSGLNSAMQDVMGNNSVIKINIFNRDGIIIFSTQPSLIGSNHSNNQQFKTAMDGQLTSKLIYRDTFSLLKKPSEDDNLVQSYLPVRLTPIDHIHGVFEIYTDVKSVVDRVEHTEALAFFGVFIILLLLYSFLVFIVRISSKTIEQQQSIIQERTKTLEILSSQMLNAHEIEKKKMAYKLHEGLAQTLAAVKNHTEMVYTKLSKSSSAEDLQPLQHNIHSLQGAIQEVRSLSMELRPPSLDHFGLIKTIEWFCNEYQNLYPDIIIHTTFTIDESSLPGSLKTLIYRIIQEALGSISRVGDANEVSLILEADSNTISLSIEDKALAYHSDEFISEQNASTSALAAMKERTLLSGGTFSIESTRQGGTLATSIWSF